MSRLFNSNFWRFYSPDDAPGIAPTVEPSAPSSDSKEDVIEFLSDDDEEEDKIEVPKGKVSLDKTEKEPDEEDEEVDELKEIEQELKGPTEEQLELITPVRRKEILAKYPTIFKDFPYLEKAYYRDQQFTEMFGTIDEAKTSAAKSEALDNFEQQIMSGDTVNVLRAVKETNPKSFNKLVDNYLGNLASVDINAYHHVLANVTKYTIIGMVKEARASGNEVLQNAAQILNQYVFGSSNWSPPQNLNIESPQEQEQNQKVNEREQQFLRQSFETSNNDINTKVNNTLKNTIEANIDPRGSMSDYVKENAVKDAIESLASLMDKDTRFKSLTDKLWEKAFKDNFSQESKDNIRKAFLSKARTLLPAVIKQARNTALRGRASRTNEESTSNKGPVPAGRPRTQTPGKIRNAKEIPRKMTTLEFLNSD